MASWWTTFVVVAAFGAAAALHAAQPGTYDRLSQEDGWVEWSTVWAFLAAGGWWCARAWPIRESGWRATFPVLVAAFCVFVAMEEVSWGQRLFGVRPPAYFLEHNWQLETNFHNLASQELRTLALSAVILGFGLGLWLLLRPPVWREALARLGVEAPAPALVPAFLACFLLYQLYPWRLTGEWVELGLGLSLLGFAVAGSGAARTPALAVAATLAVAAAGWATAAVTRAEGEAAPERLAEVTRELDALKRDHRAGLLRTDCDTHTRVFRFVAAREGLAEEAARGAFGGLVAEGMPSERARFFLDPWETPYWVVDACRDDGSRRIAFYSFGPNRARDSDHWTRRGDDVAVAVYEWIAPPDDGGVEP